MRAKLSCRLLLILLISAVLIACGGNTASPSPSPAPNPGVAPTIQFSANPTSIADGQTAALSWTATHATTVSIQPGAQGLAASGSMSVSPTSSTTYTATATGPGGSASASATIKVSSAVPPPSASGFAFGHVVIVAMENKNYDSVVGNTAAMPYLNSLISSYGLGTSYYANTHPSIGNYFMLTTGQILINDDTFTGVITADNVVRQLTAAGKSWRSYAEDLPQAGYLGGNVGLYVRRHNPFTYFSDVQNDAGVAQSHIVPFSQFAADLAAGSLPQYSFIVPNLINDAHECPGALNACLAIADEWLRSNFAPLLNDPVFRNDGVLIVWFDESASDNSHGGGKVPIVFVSPAWSKTAYRSTTFGQHENTLRFTLDALGVASPPGAAAAAHGWNEFFNSH